MANETKKLEATINGKVYNLDSDNLGLLDKLEKVKYNKETKQMDDVPYLPISVIYQLLEQFYPDYSFESHPLEREGTYVVSKSKMNWTTKEKESIEEEVIMFKKSIRLILGDRTIEGSARGVASIGQITIDQVYNGFDMKQEARAIKNAVKKLGKVFRIPNDWEETMEKDSIQNDLSITDIVKNISKDTPKVPTKEEPIEDTEADLKFQVLNKDFRELVKEHKGEPLVIADLQRFGVELREKHSFKKDDPENELMMKVYRTLKEELKL